AVAAAIGAERARLEWCPFDVVPPRATALDREPVKVGPLRFRLERDLLARDALLALGDGTGARLLSDLAVALPDSSLRRVSASAAAAIARRERRLELTVLLGGPGAGAIAHAHPLGFELELAALAVLFASNERERAWGLLERRYGVAP